MAKLILKHRRGTTEEWANSNVIIEDGEIVLEECSDGQVKVKVGNGGSTFSELDYVTGKLEESVLSLESRYSEHIRFNDNGEFFGEGTVEGELIDARIGANGTVYKNVGDAIREVDHHVSALQGSLSDFIAAEAVDGLEYNKNGDYMLYLTAKGEPIERTGVKVVGGSGGGGESGNLYINYVTPQDVICTPGDEVVLKYTFSGTDSSGDAISNVTETWKIDGTVITTRKMKSGDATEFDITPYIQQAGTHVVLLVMTNVNGAYAQKSWDVQTEELSVSTTFDDKVPRPLGPVAFDYSVTGAVDKYVHFKLDGQELDTVFHSSSVTGPTPGYTLPAKPHGSYLLEVYVTATIGGKTITSQPLSKDIMWLDDAKWQGNSDSVPLVSVPVQKFKAQQYDTTNIEYTVLDSTTTTPTAVITVDGEVVSTPTLLTATTYFPFKTDVVGTHTITISCGSAIRTVEVEVTKLDIVISPVTAGLAFDFVPDTTNDNSDRLWTNGEVSLSVSDNFDWVNGGYHPDAAGDNCFCVKSGTTATFDYELFGDENATTNGKEMKLVFKTSNVASPDAVFMHCVDSLIDATDGYYIGGNFYSDLKGENEIIAVDDGRYRDLTTGRYFVYSDDKYSEVLDNLVGIRMGVHEATIFGGATNLSLAYSENDIIEFEFNMSRITEDVPMVMGYEDGVSTRPMVYTSANEFTQKTHRYITIGSPDCDVYIYRFKAYNTSLTAKGILDNFIADARTADEMVDRYKRNQIYNSKNELDPDTLAEKCPWLRIIKLEAPYFTNHKDNRVPNTTVECIYKNGDRPEDNWIATDAVHSGQGTSSNNYGAAGRNLDIMVKRTKDKETNLYLNTNPQFKLSDGTLVKKVSLSETSIPVNYFNIKVNIASSNNLTNAILARKFNAMNPARRNFVDSQCIDGVDDVGNPIRIPPKDTMEFYNCVVFIKETDKDIAKHREFADTNWHFYAIGNIGDSKKTDDTRLTDPDDKYECCVEIMDVELPLADFPRDTMMNAMFTKTDKKTNVTYYPIAVDSNIGILYERTGEQFIKTLDSYINTNKVYYRNDNGSMVNAMDFTIDEDGKKQYIWAVPSNLSNLYELVPTYELTKDTAVDYSKIYYVDILEHDDFSENYTYGWRYISDDEDEEVLNYCHQKWIDMYRFVTTSTTEEFYQHLDKYFVRDSVLFFYLFTTRYCMVDNRAKNTFWHYGKTGEKYKEDIEIKGANGQILFSAKAGEDVRKWDLNWDYDNDTSLGLNNYGAQVYRYGLEDTDVDEKGEEVFREMDSTFFCRVRDLFATELSALYQLHDSDWNAESFIKECDEWQAEFPEELWRLDIERKYIRTYNHSFINGGGSAQFLTTMSNGRMKYQRRQWERSQEQYMASKYQTTTAISDTNGILMRCATTSGDLAVTPNYRIKVTPYSYVYLNVKYSTGEPHYIRAVPNKEYEIPFNGDGTDIVNVYSANCIKSIGDLSSCYLSTLDTSSAPRLKELIVGNSTPGYDNPYFYEFTPGSNVLVEKLNFENVSGLTQSLDLRPMYNLKELYIKGSNVGGVIVADGGKLETAELPDTITSIELRNLLYVSSLDAGNLSKLTKLVIENCDTIDILPIVHVAPNLYRVRLTDVDWEVDNAAILTRLAGMTGVDGEGKNTSKPVITGKVHIKSLNGEDYKIITETFGSDLHVSFDYLESNIYFTDENDVVIHTSQVLNPEVAGTTVSPNGVSLKIIPPIVLTRASTPQYSYTHEGWTTVKGSEIEDADVFNNILSDRVVYPRFVPSVRNYTVRYFTGNRLIYEEVVPYGTPLTYDPSKASLNPDRKVVRDDGTPIKQGTYSPDMYIFSTFLPSDVHTVTGDIDLFAEFTITMDGMVAATLSEFEYTKDDTNKTLSLNRYIAVPNDYTDSDVDEENDNDSMTFINEKYEVMAQGGASLGEYEVVSVGGFGKDSAMVQVEHCGLPDTVTTIQNKAFEGCDRLLDATIGENVTSLGNRAFSGCTSLEEVDYRARNANITFSGVAASYAPFAYSVSDEGFNLTIGKDVESLPQYLFSNAAANDGKQFIQSIEWEMEDGSDSVKCKTIGARAFSAAVPKSFQVPNGVTTLGTGALEKDNYHTDIDVGDSVTDTTVGLPTTLTHLGDKVFDGWTQLERVHLPNSITTINGAFLTNCPNVRELSIEDGGRYMTSYNCIVEPSTRTVIQGCAGSKVAGGANGMKYIGANAFYGSGITSPEDPQDLLPESLSAIDSYAFQGCSKLTEVKIPDSISALPIQCFQDCTSLNHIELHDGITSINTYCFWGCTSLPGVSLPSSLTFISDGCFFQCSNLRTVEWGGSEVSIGKKAFSESGLYEVILPDSITSVGESAFGICVDLNSFTFGGGFASGTSASVNKKLFNDCISLSVIKCPFSETSPAGKLAPFGAPNPVTVIFNYGTDNEVSKTYNN